MFFLQALAVIQELQKHFPIKRSPMRLRLIVPEQKFSSLSENLNAWKATIVSKDESGSQLYIVSLRHRPLRRSQNVVNATRRSFAEFHDFIFHILLISVSSGFLII